jgi:hypothetical protein
LKNIFNAGIKPSRFVFALYNGGETARAIKLKVFATEKYLEIFHPREPGQELLRAACHSTCNEFPAAA